MITMRRPQRMEVHAPDGLLAELFDAYSQGRQLKLSTKDDTASAVKPFLTWWQTHHEEHGWVLSIDTVNQYFEWFYTEYRHRNARQVHPQKMAAKTAMMLRRIFRWAHQTGCIPVDVSEIVPTIERPAFIPLFLDPQDIKRLVLAPAGAHATRDRAFIAALASTGARRDELTHLTAADIFFWSANQYNLDPAADHTGYTHLKTVKGKRAGGRVVCFDGICGLLLKRWLVAGGNGILFPVTAQRLYDVIVEMANAVGLQGVTPHTLRRTFGNHWLIHNKQFGEIADLARRLQMGHTADRGNVSLYHYSDWRVDAHRPERTARKIQGYYVSPLKTLHDSGDWDWAAIT